MIDILKKYIDVIIKSFKDFIADDALKFSASLSYYSVFSIAPVLIIIIGLTRLFFDEQSVSTEIYKQFSELMGDDAAKTVQQAIYSIKHQQQSLLTTIIGTVTLLVGATGVFTELQDSLNKIWSVKTTVTKGWLKYLINRLISFSMILTLGFLLMVSLLINALIALLSNRYFTVLNEWQWLSLLINNLIILIIVTFLFAFIFKFLPDVKLRWRNVITGAFFTSILFFIGKYLIATYLSKTIAATAFGAAGSLALILLWVYYSSAILFLGAEFTKNYALANHTHIEADEFAHFVVTKEKQLSEHTDAQKVEDIKEVIKEQAAEKNKK